ncbi:MAG TPA: HAD family hydrolase [Mycobacteriales bacterium]|jgi:HAD superfamily hydrolase (TIGR01490 family)|nr:HAD family hydrolase [Mycobacteriales bacterium]
MASAAFFDLDKTIIATSSTLALGRTFYDSGLISRGTVMKGAYARLTYHLGRVDEERMARLRDGMARMITGWDVEHVNEIVGEAFRDLIDPLVYDEAAVLIEEHQAAGRPVVIVSSSGEEVVGPIGELLGADHVIATRMAVVDGRYTGELEFYSFGPHKATAIRELAAERGWTLADCYAYSDSATDVPMLEAVGHPYAVNPDRGLRREAMARGWPVLRFRHPVPLRTRVGRSSRPVALGVAGAAVVAAAARWGYAHRSSSRVWSRRAG